MSETKTSSEMSQLTPHAMLVIWGLYAQQMGLITKIKAVPMKQKSRTHTPQTKVLELFVAILAGLPHLKEISRSGHPLDQDQVVAEAWGQPAWADYSGVSRTLKNVTTAETDSLVAMFEQVEQNMIDQEVNHILASQGYLIYDGDLTGRPVSVGSQTYPDVAFGHMGNSVKRGYQSALVSMESATYGRLWLSNKLHPGNNVSQTQTKAMVLATEGRVKRQPKRRSDLVKIRLERAQQELVSASQVYEESLFQLKEAQLAYDDAQEERRHWQQEVFSLTQEYQRQDRVQTSHCQLSRAQQKLATYEKRLPRRQQDLARAQRRLDRDEVSYDEAGALVDYLEAHFQQLEEENRLNPDPICAVFRLDGGFASWENVHWLIEMGYDVYTRGIGTTLRDTLSLWAQERPDDWLRVGRNATMMAWPDTDVNGRFAYPLNVSLLHYHTTDAAKQKAVLLHYGQAPVTADVAAWFHTYNGRQTIEAGIKEGKNIFQMHHFKVRSLQAIRLQEHMACFAANFVRFAAHWLRQQPQLSQLPTTSIKEMVQVSAHTSAWVNHNGDVWLLMFTQQSLYAGQCLHFGIGPCQMLLPF